MLIEEERTHKHFLSRGYLLHDGVVAAARPWCCAPLLTPALVHPNCWNMWCIALLGLAAVFGEVVNFPAIIERVTGRCELLRWPDCNMLLLCWRGAVVLLLWAVAPEL
jgi:hypothetical protein